MKIIPPSRLIKYKVKDFASGKKSNMIFKLLKLPASFQSPLSNYEIWRGEQIDNCEQICSSYFTA